MSMTSNDVYERLRALEQLVDHLYRQTGVPMPDLRALAQARASDRVRELLLSGNKLAAVKAYHEETGVDLAAARKFVDSLQIG